MAHASLDDSCPAEEDIAAFVRGGMAASQRSALEAHVVGCDACRRLLSALARAADSESQSGDDSVAPTLPLASRTSDAELPPGARFGRYVVQDWLGAGGMGVVYSVYDPDLNRKVALKVLRNDGVDRLPTRDLLLAEAQAMARLAHPNVVTVFDVGSVDDRVFLAMELIEGQTLAGWLRTSRRKPSEILAMFVAAGRGLAAAHAAGLIHRDFKPDNVLVGNDGRVCVTDFGLARAAPPGPDSAARGPSDRVAASAPQTGLAGTLAYMAPEQYLGRSVDARADQFSFAVALYEALYGELPFASPPVSGDPPAVTTPPLRGVPVALRQVLLRALRSDPADRHPSITELLAALAPRSRRAHGLAAIVVVTAAVAAASGYAIHLRQSATEDLIDPSRIVLRRANQDRSDPASQIDPRRAKEDPIDPDHLRSVVPELRTALSVAHMLPLHDIRPALDDVRSKMRKIELLQQAATARDEIAVIAFVLGEGHRALGEQEVALELLVRAWSAGERGPQINAALGEMLGASYLRHREWAESMQPWLEHEGSPAGVLEYQFRDPALVHLHAALDSHASSPEYLEALIAFHERRFQDAARSADSARDVSWTFYEARELAAKAHHEAGRALLAANRRDAQKEFSHARDIFGTVLTTAPSDDGARLRYGEMLYAQARDLGNDGELLPDLRQQAVDAFHAVRQINPDRWESSLFEMEIYAHEANLAILSDGDPRPYVDHVLKMAEEVRVHGAAVDQFVCLAHWVRAVYDSAHGANAHANFAQAVASCEHAVALLPHLPSPPPKRTHAPEPAPTRDQLLARFAATAQREASDVSLVRMAAEIAHAREAHPMNATAWMLSAEVEQLRAEADQMSEAAAIERGRAFIEQAIKIEPLLTGARRMRDEFADRAASHRDANRR